MITAFTRLFAAAFETNRAAFFPTLRCKRSSRTIIFWCPELCHFRHAFRSDYWSMSDVYTSRIPRGDIALCAGAPGARVGQTAHPNEAFSDIHRTPAAP